MKKAPAGVFFMSIMPQPMAWFYSAVDTLAPLSGYSPDLMPVEPLWHWLREDLTYHHGHATAEDLIRRVAAFEAAINQDPYAVADRLWVKDALDPEEEKLRFSK